MEQTYNQYVAKKIAKQDKWYPSVKVRKPLPGEYVQRYINFSTCFGEIDDYERRGRDVK
jgi:hypothetical protein